MALYVPEYEGYIADVPNLLFERCDGKRFYYDELDSFSATQNSNVLTINGGQSNFPLAQIDTDKTFELTFGSAKFTLAMFEMANATDVHKNDIGILDGGLYEVETGLKITLPFETQENSIYIAGMTQATTAAAGTNRGNCARNYHFCISPCWKVYIVASIFLLGNICRKPSLAC